MKLTAIQRDPAPWAPWSASLLATRSVPATSLDRRFLTTAQSEMKGGGTFDWQPGEWTDRHQHGPPDCAGTLAPRGDRLDSAQALNEIVGAWEVWSPTKRRTSGRRRGSCCRGSTSRPRSCSPRVAARAVHQEVGQSGGNGSLMRTAPVALGYLNNAPGLAVAARVISDLTHFDEDAGDACVLWSLAICHAILTGQADVRVGLPQLAEARRSRWIELVEAAEAAPPKAFSRNGWVVEAFRVRGRRFITAMNPLTRSSAPCVEAATPTPSRRR